MNKILRNFLFLSGAELLLKIFGFFAVVFLARVLGPKGFGEIGFASAILAYFLLLVNLGLDTFGVREAARDPIQINNYLNNIVTIRLVAFVISFLFLLIFIYFIPKPLEVKKLILYYGLSLFSFSLAIEWVFIGIERMEYVAISRVVRQGIYLVLILAMVKGPQQILSIPFIYFGSTLIGSIILLLFFIEGYGAYKLKFDLPFWKKILHQSLPMGFSYIMIQIYYNFGLVMLGFLKGEETVGWYNAAYKIILLLLVLPTLVVTVFFPLLSSYFKSNFSQLKDVASMYVKILVIVSIPFGFGGTVLAKELISSIYGQTYSAAILAFRILIWDLVIVFLNIAYGNPLMAWDLQKKHMKCIALGAGINLIFNILLIPKYSLYGASVATILAELVVFLGVYPIFQKIVKVNIFSQITKPILASVGMTMSLVFTKEYLSSIFILIPFGVVVYSILLWILKGITRKDFDFLLGKTGKLVT